MTNMANMSNHLKSYSTHDEQLLAVMTNMIESHPDAKILMASYNVINIEGDGLGEFLQEIVKQVPVLKMRTYKIKKSNGKHKQRKHEVVDNGLEKNCVWFTFYGLEKRERMNIPPSQPVDV